MGPVYYVYFHDDRLDTWVSVGPGLSSFSKAKVEAKAVVAAEEANGRTDLRVRVQVRVFEVGEFEAKVWDSDDDRRQRARRGASPRR